MARVVSCSVADAGELMRCNIPAFRRQRTWAISWQHITVEQHVAMMTGRFPARLIKDRTVTRHQKAIDPDGRVVGYARWTLPSSHANYWQDAVVPAVPEEEEAEIRRVFASIPFEPNHDADVLENVISDMASEFRANKVFLYLEYLAVHVDDQGKGIGTMLVQSGIDQAKSMGLDIYVLAFPPAFHLYQRLGFVIERELVQDYSEYGGDSDYTTRCMVLRQS